MSSWLCFICHNIVSLDTNDEIRDKYRELIGMNLSSESYLCRVCTHLLDKFWFFKSVCLKRSLEYPVLFSEKGTINLQPSDVEINTLCVESACAEHNNKSHHFLDRNDNALDNVYDIFNEYIDLPDAKNDFDAISETLKPNNDPEFEENHSNEQINDNQVNNQIDDENCALQDTHHETVDCHDDNEETNNEIITDDNLHDEENDKVQVNENGIEENGGKNKEKRSKRKREFDKVILSLEEQKAELERNRKEKKYLEAEFKCYNCALGFLFKDTYQAHMMRHEESNGEYRCVACSLRFATPAVLRAHAPLHSERHVCRQCRATVRARARASHAARCYGRHEHVAACHKCPRLFRDSAGLQQHLKRFHRSPAGRGYSCGVCGQRCGSQAAVRTHMIKHIQRTFPCSQCPSVFRSPYSLTQHQRGHRAPPEHCAPCGKSFKNRRSLLAHQRNAKDHQQQSFECPICGRSCANQRSLTYHVDSVHSATKDYACDRCSARYATQRALTRHVRAHDAPPERKEAVCHLCGRGFKGNNKLNRHLREVCEKEKLEEELSSYYAQQDGQ